MKTVAIHQPNFFPWLGYFNKIARADVFILLDDAQFPKKGGTWTNRMKMLIGDSPKWMTLPVDRSYHGVREIRSVQVDRERIEKWKGDFLKTLDMNYSRHPWFSQVMELIDKVLTYDGTLVSEFNIRGITGILEYLGMSKANMKKSSDFADAGVSTERLINLTKMVGGDVYMCGGGASGYQEDEMFAARGIGLRYQNFAHPVYRQHHRGDFVPGLSILDAMFNCSKDEVRSMVLNGG